MNTKAKLKSPGGLWGFFVFSLLLSATPAHASLNFIIERPLLLYSSLRSALNIQCNRNFKGLHARWRAESCQTATLTMLREMDLAPICGQVSADKKICGVVVFKNELLDLLGLSEVYDFLKVVNQRFDDMNALPSASLDLWEQAIRFSGSESEALRWMSVLFQDTASTEYHLLWASDQNLSAFQKIVFVELERAINFFSQFYYEHKDYRLRTFPFPLGGGRGGPYHFYVIASLRERLSKHLAPGLDRLLPFLLNYVYEIQTSSENPIWDTLSDSATISDPVTAYDVYLGYLGVSWDLTDHVPLTFGSIVEMLREEPSLLLQSIAQLSKSPLN